LPPIAATLNKVLKSEQPGRNFRSGAFVFGRRMSIAGGHS